MMNEQQNKAAPYKTEPKTPVTEYKVLANGDVKIKQIVETISWWKARDFLSLMRQNEDALKNTQYNTSEEFIAKMHEQEKTIIAEIELMKPIMKDAEGKTQVEYEKQRHEGIKKSVIAEIEDPKKSEAWFQNVWLRTKKEVRDPIFKELTMEQQKKVLKCVMRLKRKGIQ